MTKLLLLVAIVLSQVASAASPVKLMTFNIRYGTANDGENRWEFRKDLVVETIASQTAAVVAIQEALPFQLSFLQDAMPQYKKVGVHRSGGKSGEFSGLLVDTLQLEILDSGQMWLSETPEEIASVGWDAALARTATWAIVRSVGTSGPSFLVIGTHFDHKGTVARLESAKLIVQKANELSQEKQLPVVIMGDLNCTPAPESAPMQVIAEAGFTPAVATHSGGTFHGFSGDSDGRRIDYILLNDKWKHYGATILRPRRDGKSASDHDPVVALVETNTPRGTIGMPRSIASVWQPKEQSLVQFALNNAQPELLDAINRVKQVIQSRPDTESDFHQLSHVVGAFKHPFALPELASDMTDRLMVLHCEPSNVIELASRMLDTVPSRGTSFPEPRPSVERVLELLSIPNDTFYIEGDQIEPMLEVIRYSTTVDFAALMATITIPTTEKQPFFGKALPPGVTGTILAGEQGPNGWRVVGGPEANTYDMTIIAEVFDVGGDDIYFANDLVVGNRLVVDLAGNDIYTGTDRQGPAAALFGTWIIDDRAGNDRYGVVGGTFSTGAAAFGVGMIIDRGGDDVYMGTQWSIGAAVYGAGIVMDLGEGNDQYLGEFLSIGVGGPRGFGFVFDEVGDELYLADGPKPSIYDTPDVYCAFSQGMGFGYRKYAAGGIGILYDLAGNDKYQAGEFSQGGAYYHGLGILRDFAGSDEYHGNRYAQGFGVHQAFGVLIDDAGDDSYWAMTAADQGSAWDIAAGALLEKMGNDTYTANGMAQGSAAMQAIAYLIDLEGNDSYNATMPTQGASGGNSYHWDAYQAFSFSLLLDLGGGEDHYSIEGRQNNTEQITQPDPDPSGSGIGLFIDR